MARSQEQAARRSAILWAALGYFAKKRTEREHLPEPGGDTMVDLTIEGKIGRAKVSENLRCKLSVGAPQPRADVAAAKPVDVIAYLLSRFEDEDRAEIAAELKNGWTDAETVPRVCETIATEAQNLMAELRTNRTKTVAGSVTAQLVES